MSEGRTRPYNGWYVHEDDRSPAIWALIESEFDMEIEYEEKRVKRRMDNERHARKMAILRLVSFPIEFISGLVLFGPQFAKERWGIQASLVKFLFGKLSYKQLLKILEGK